MAVEDSPRTTSGEAVRIQAQMKALAEAAGRVMRAPGLQATLQAITDAARNIVGAHQSVCSLTRGRDWSQSISAVSLSAKYATWQDYATGPDGSGIYAWVCEENRPVRMTQAELEAHPRWRGFGAKSLEHPPMHGWLAAPLLGNDGRNLGLIQLSDKIGGEFDEADEAIVVQLAQFAASAIERAEVESSLRESEARFRHMADSAPALIWMTDEQGRQVFANMHHDYLFGRPAAEMLGEGWREVVWPEDLPGHEAAFREAFAARRPYRRELRVIDRHGAVRWLRCEGVVRLDDHGRFLGYTGCSVDISAAKHAEAELRRLNETLERRVAERTAQLAASEVRFRTYFESSPDLVFLIKVSPEGVACFEAINPAAERFTGMKAADTIGWPVETVLPPAIAETIAQRYRRCAEEQRRMTYETVYEVEGERRVADVILVPMGEAEGGGRLVLGNARDITRTQALEEQLRQAQKMEAVGQLTGGIAHDFNNLLTGIIGALAILERRVEAGQVEGLERYTSVAVTSAQRAAALTQRLLAFARRQPLDPRPVEANRLIAGMEELLRRTLGPAIVLELRLAEGLWPTRCDPNQLENAILNLAINARDAMPEGGRLTIGTETSVLDQAAARAIGGELLPGEYVTINVGDTGTGMPPEVLERAFEPFFTTKPIGQGTGLGLSMLYGFVKQSGGHVRVESAAGQGTVFRLTLPRHRGTPDRAEAEERDGRAPRSGRGETVLVVEDEPSVRLLIIETLKDLGYATLETADGPAGLEAIRSGARIDLLVTDVGLPGMNGRQLADAARELRPGLKVLFVTGYAHNTLGDQAPLQPGMELLTKPFSLTELGRRIHALIDS
ncbi:PAS domain S-box protein [Belnapia sp. F-4-1]|uniref:PAS domain S-box protein n=1 Tax=Belnapia sp. F-4-1 TaxID=1545443 RepID=UPI00068C6F5B|nr:PAS domain S-box protein [Belnapia sp. F-4-1]